jgi:hypothetical protein
MQLLGVPTEAAWRMTAMLALGYPVDDGGGGRPSPCSRSEQQKPMGTFHVVDRLITRFLFLRQRESCVVTPRRVNAV